MAPLAVLAPIIGGAIAGGGTVASSLINKSGQKGLVGQQVATANEQNQLARDTYNRSTPAFNQAMQYYSGLTAGGPQLQAAVAPSANAINQQWDSAYKNLLGNAYTRGGALDKGLRGIQSGRAFSLADLYGKAQGEGAQGLLQLSGMGSGAQSGLAASAATLANAQNAQLAQQAQRSQALGGVGSILTRLLTTPGIFGSGNNNSAQVPANNGDVISNGLPSAFAGLA